MAQLKPINTSRNLATNLGETDVEAPQDMAPPILNPFHLNGDKIKDNGFIQFIGDYLNLAQLWAQILGINQETIDQNDNFFQLGGDSLAAMRLSNAAMEAGFMLFVDQIFQYPALAQMAQLPYNAAHVKTKQAIGPFSLIAGEVNVEQCISDVATMCSADTGCIEDIFPCTPLQEGLLALTAKSQGDYTLREVMHLASEVDISRFRQAWEQTYKAIPILRTRIVEHDVFGFLQVVVDEHVNWAHGQDLDMYIEDDKTRGMSLGNPLVRYALIQDRKTCTMSFVWTLHHSLYDRVTLRHMKEVFRQFYYGIAIKESPGFNTYVEHLLNKSQVSALAFWEWVTLEFDSGTFPPLPTGLSEGNPDISVSRTIPFPINTCTKNITPSMLIRAAWALVVHYNTGTDDVVFGTTLSGRNVSIPGLNDMIGPTIATVPVRVRVPVHEAVTVSEFLEGVQDQAADMMPFEHAGLQHISRINSEAQQACNFQTTLTVQHVEEDPLVHDSATIGVWRHTPDVLETATYPLVIVCTLGQNNIEVVANVDSRVLGASMVERMLAQLDHTIGQLASLPDAKLSALDHITPGDLETIWKWNKAVQPAVEMTLHDIISQKGKEQPSAIAIDGWDGKLTYSELESISTRFAQHLIKQGVGNGSLVPLLFEKSTWAIVARLAVLKAGGAFVPLDPTQAEGRRENILEQIDAHVTLTSEQYRGLLLGSERQVIPISLESLQKLHGSELDVVSLPHVSPQDIAYVIFTSGSTGVPKGVITQHRAIATSLLYHSGLAGIDSHTRVMQFSSYTFDASIWDIFTTLIAGGTICTVSDSSLRNELETSICRMQVNTILVTPSVGRLIQPQETPCLTHILFIGESPLQEDFERWRHIRITQTYGPTEAAVLCTSSSVSNETQSVYDIGTATGSVCWIVDPSDHGKLAPVGAVGELLIEGPILAQGYLKDPIKTANSFIENPNWLLKGTPDSPGRYGRLYKTGDLVRYGEDGRFIILGRKDTQVKVRGQRLELEGVEHHVLKCMTPYAQQVVAEICKETDAASSVLATFVVLDSEATQHVEFSSAEREFDGLRMRSFSPSAAVEDQLSGYLPSYMIPTLWFAIDKIPLSSAGKTDRKRLRMAGSVHSKFELADGDARSKTEEFAPKTEAERALISLCAQVLGLEEAGIRTSDNFFRIGGDSISAMRLVGAARKAGYIITVSLIFQHPRLSDLATFWGSVKVDSVLEQVLPFSLLSDVVDPFLLREQVGHSCNVDAVAILDAYPCSPLQEGLLALSSVQTGDYVLQSVLELSPSVDVALLRAAWEQTVQELPILRTRIVQHLTLGLIQAVIDYDVKWQVGDDLDAYLRQDKLRPMNLGEPLGRYGIVIENKTGKKYFVATIHHALYDAESWSMVQKHFTMRYHSRVPTEHANFNQVIKSILNTDTLAAQEFWKKSFVGFVGSVFPPFTPGENKIVADETIRSGPFQVSSGAEVTIASIVRAAWALVVHQYTGVNDVVFGALLSGRNMAVHSINKVVGPTIATVPFRVRVPSSDSPSAAFLRQVQDTATSMITFEQTGLQHIAKLSNEAQRACNFQTLLVVNASRSIEGAGLEDTDDFGKWLQLFQTQEFTSYAVTINCNLSASGVQLECSFDPRVVEQWKMQRMLDQTIFMIQQLAGSGRHVESLSKLADLKSLTPVDDEQIRRWNSPLPPRVDECVHGIIQRQIDLNPQAPAIHSWDGDLTYQGLDQVSGRLASCLLQKRLIEGSPVLLCFEKSMWTVVAKLAVLRAGGAFVLVEPTLPKHRILSIVRQTGATLALASVSGHAIISPSVPETIVVDGTLFDLDVALRELPFISPSSIAYIPFTSGTTGEPKGSLIPHSSFASAIHYQAHRLTCQNARVFDFASYSFDGCVQNSLMTLAVGGCICIPSESDRKDNLTHVIAAMEVNCMLLTPSVARLVDFDRLPLMKQLNLGGEAIRATDIERVPTRIRIVNNYGPSECTVNSVINDDQNSREQLSRLGTGVGACTWVVDPDNHERLLPVGAVGELILEGPVVGQGYIGNPEATTAAFIDAPVWSGRSAKLYKTGDLVQYNEDGVLSYLGRKDSQVKLRGQRIELGEVEHHVLACMPEVGGAVAEVLCNNNDDSSATLAAFVLDQESDHHTAPRLFTASKSVEDQLIERVPSYLIPTVWVAVAGWPLTVNGKIDRKALREIGSSFSRSQLAQLSHSAHQDKRYPTTEPEILLSQLFTQVLRLDTDDISVSIDDSFLRMGGDSIAAMQVSAEARARGLSVSTADILRHKTIAAILEFHRGHPISKVKTESVGSLVAGSHVTEWTISSFPGVFASYQEAEVFKSL
ncbi:hypothetical protein IL306_013810 [Fusarium sp. DS 682]|nr:hypothetical protein IL306_013810 [Fusarium sp. DS 682]